MLKHSTPHKISPVWNSGFSFNKAFVLLALFVCLVSATAWGQTREVLVPQVGSDIVHISPSDSLRVFDSGGDGNYMNNTDGVLYIVSDSGTAIHIRGIYNIEPSDMGCIYDGAFDVYHRIAFMFDYDTIDLICYSGIAIITMTSNLSYNLSGFMLEVVAFPIDRSTIFNVNSVVTGRNATITWSDTSDASTWYVKYGYSPYTLTSMMTSQTTLASFTGVPAMTTLFYKVFNEYTIGDASVDTIERTFHFVVDDGVHQECINYANLNGPNVTCYYGSITNVYANTGLVNHGPGAVESRHTVHTSPTERDPRTNNMLRTVPEGFPASVRLGNWNHNYQAECIVYKHFVDTNLNGLILLNYAAVLQAPNHTLSEEPRFTFEILDCAGVPIDPLCYSAYFIANNSSGWQHTNSADWKDWTSVGFDISALHHQNISIRLTTYDCGEGAHYGYAYYTISCMAKCLHSSMCGDPEENTFTAPSGFSYEWYETSDPNLILSTDQTFHSTQRGDYRCRLSFKNTDYNQSCSFELSTNSAKRFPYAQYDYSYEALPNCDLSVQFFDRSTVTSDWEHNNPTNLQCDRVEWFFDNDHSVENNPTFQCTPGLHTVTLIAKIDDGGCYDTLTEVIRLDNLCYDTVYATICYGDSFRLYDTLISSSGVYERDSLYFHRTLFLSVLPPNIVHITVRISNNDLPYTFNGIVFHDTISNFNMHLVDRNGCDSTIVFSLLPWQDHTIYLDTVICDNQFPLFWHDTVINQAGIVSVTYRGMHNTDSTLVLTVTTKPTFSTSFNAAICSGEPYKWLDGVTYYESTSTPTLTLTATNGCDSVLHLNLRVDHIEAEMTITPLIADFEHSEVTLCDVTNGSVERQWSYLDNIDTRKEFTFVFPKELDTVGITLAVKSSAGCRDSATAIALADHAVIWAPNAFTPDESQNNRFFIQSNDITAGEVWVYTRQGQLVARFDALTGSWDGTLNGKLCPVGAYTWVMKYTTVSQPRIIHQAKGTVTVIR